MTEELTEEITETSTGHLSGSEQSEITNSPDLDNAGAGNPALGNQTEETDTDIEAEPETFSRSYVEKLRKESATYRERAQRTGDLAAALWTARVTATGRLADPTDLALPEDTDPMDAEAVTVAVDDLLAVKPHLASRKPSGDVGQGATGTGSGTVDLAGILRSRAT